MDSNAAVSSDTKLRVNTLVWAALFIHMTATGSLRDTVTSPAGASRAGLRWLNRPMDGCMAGAG